MSQRRSRPTSAPGTPGAPDSPTAKARATQPPPEGECSAYVKRLEAADRDRVEQLGRLEKQLDAVHRLVAEVAQRSTAQDDVMHREKPAVDAPKLPPTTTAIQAEAPVPARACLPLPDSAQPLPDGALIASSSGSKLVSTIPAGNSAVAGGKPIALASRCTAGPAALAAGGTSKPIALAKPARIDGATTALPTSIARPAGSTTASPTSSGLGASLAPPLTSASPRGTVPTSRPTAKARPSAPVAAARPVVAIARPKSDQTV